MQIQLFYRDVTQKSIIFCWNSDYFCKPDVPTLAYIDCQGTGDSYRDFAASVCGDN